LTNSERSRRVSGPTWRLRNQSNLGCAQKIALSPLLGAALPSYSGQEPPGRNPILRPNLGNEREAHRRSERPLSAFHSARRRATFASLRACARSTRASSAMIAARARTKPRPTNWSWRQTRVRCASPDPVVGRHAVRVRGDPEHRGISPRSGSVSRFRQNATVIHWGQSTSKGTTTARGLGTGSPGGRLPTRCRRPRTHADAIDLVRSVPASRS
jgi:hypothetical protein